MKVEEIRKKQEPTFSFVGNEAKLYPLENKAIKSISEIADYRAEAYNEALWSCAMPEAIHVVLSSFDKTAVEKAVKHWLKNKDLSKGEYIAKHGYL